MGFLSTLQSPRWVILFWTEPPSKNILLHADHVDMLTSRERESSLNVQLAQLNVFSNSGGRDYESQ